MSSHPEHCHVVVIVHDEIIKGPADGALDCHRPVVVIQAELRADGADGELVELGAVLSDGLQQPGDIVASKGCHRICCTTMTMISMFRPGCHSWPVS